MRKQGYILLFLLGLTVSLYAAVASNKTDFEDFCTGKNNTNCVWQIDTNGNITANSGLLQGTMTAVTSVIGTPGVPISTTAVAGTDTGVSFPAVLEGQIAAQEGSILSVVGSSSTQINVQVTLGTANLSNVVGVAASAAGLGSIVNVYTSGFVNALTTGTINAGDLLVTSGPWAGGTVLAAWNTPGASSVTIVGVALSSQPATGNLTKIRLR
jgi:hypothetical protein